MAKDFQNSLKMYHKWWEIGTSTRTNFAFSVLILYDWRLSAFDRYW